MNFSSSFWTETVPEKQFLAMLGGGVLLAALIAYAVVTFTDIGTIRHSAGDSIAAEVSSLDLAPVTNLSAEDNEKTARERLTESALTDGGPKLNSMVRAFQDAGISFPPSHAAKYAEITCEAIRDGLGPTRVAEMWSEEVTDYSVADHYILTGAAIDAYCPGG